MITGQRRISKIKQARLLKAFTLDTTSFQASKIAKVSPTCAYRYFRHFRELIYERARQYPRFFGTVEMDQAFFGGGNKKKIRSALKRMEGLPHREYMQKSIALRDRHRVMIFGILQRGGPVYAHMIKKADNRTLMAIIRLVVEQGSTVLTDKWRGFTELGIDGYKHDTVNHATEYITEKGVHIGGIESFWSFAKRRLAKFNGLARTTFILHVKECEFRYNHRDDLEKALKAILKP